MTGAAAENRIDEESAPNPAESRLWGGFLRRQRKKAEMPACAYGTEKKNAALDGGIIKPEKGEEPLFSKLKQ